jgi:hypothetical protein
MKADSMTRCSLVFPFSTTLETIFSLQTKSGIEFQIWFMETGARSAGGVETDCRARRGAGRSANDTAQ